MHLMLLTSGGALPGGARAWGPCSSRRAFPAGSGWHRHRSLHCSASKAPEGGGAATAEASQAQAAPAPAGTLSPLLALSSRLGLGSSAPAIQAEQATGEIEAAGSQTLTQLGTGTDSPTDAGSEGTGSAVAAFPPQDASLTDEWQLGDGMAACAAESGPPTPSTEPSGSSSNSSSGSMLAWLLPTSLALRLGLKQPAAAELPTPATGGSTGSSGASSLSGEGQLAASAAAAAAAALAVEAAEAGDEGPAAPAYLEGRPSSFRSSSHAEVVDALGEADGMAAAAAEVPAGVVAAIQDTAPAPRLALGRCPRQRAKQQAGQQQQQQQQRGSGLPEERAGSRERSSGSGDGGGALRFGDEQVLRELLEAQEGLTPPASSPQPATSTLGPASATKAAEKPALTADPTAVADGAASERATASPAAAARLNLTGSPGSAAAPADPALAPAEGPQAVLSLLRRRVAEGSVPGGRRDGCKLGLVVEGGGMKGVVNGGALQALHDLGLKDAFDAVYGASAGALNATYFLSGQREGVHIYHDHIATPEFISLRRLWKGPLAPVLNLGYLVDSVMHEVHTLDWGAVIRSPVPLKVVASSLDALGPVLLSGFRDRADLATCLKASACVPEIAGGPILHRGHRLVDAAVFEAIPFRSAIADGCTHVLVLTNRQLAPRAPWSISTHLEEAMVAVIKRAVLSPDYMLPAWQVELENLRRDGMREDDMLMEAMQPGADPKGLPWLAGSHVLTLMPGPPANFSPLCIDPPTLCGGLAEGRAMVLRGLRPALGDLLDFDGLEEEEKISNIVPLAAAGSDKKEEGRKGGEMALKP